MRGIHWSLVDSPHKGQWCGALMFSLICDWTNGWASTQDTGDLRCHRAHYNGTVMCKEWNYNQTNFTLNFDSMGTEASVKQATFFCNPNHDEVIPIKYCMWAKILSDLKPGIELQQHVLSSQSILPVKNSYWQELLALFFLLKFQLVFDF